MYILKAENEYKNIINLTAHKGYVITSIEGLNPPGAIINKTKNAAEDGSVLNSTSLDDRQIIITLNINAPVEKNRLELYKYFRSGKPVKLYYKNDTRDVSIEGIVQNFTVDYFAKKQVGQITIDCTNPYFKGLAQEVETLSNVDNLVEFPLSIEEDTPIAFSEVSNNNLHILNSGEVETGFEVQIHAVETVSNPVIYNMETGKYFGVAVMLGAGDSLIINTKKKEKEVLLQAGISITSVASKIITGSTWLELIPGANELSVNFEGNPEGLYSTFTVDSLYLGV